MSQSGLSTPTSGTGKARLVETTVDRWGATAHVFTVDPPINHVHGANQVRITINSDGTAFTRAWRGTPDTSPYIHPPIHNAGTPAAVLKALGYQLEGPA